MTSGKYYKTLEHRKKLSIANSGKSSLRTGKTYEEMYGKEKAKKIKEKMTQGQLKNWKNNDKRRQLASKSLASRKSWSKGKKLVERIPITCQTCKKIIFVMPPKAKTRKYCGRQCFYKSLPGTKIGENNPAKRLEVRKKISESICLGYKNGRQVWIKGLTAKTDDRVAKMRRTFELRYSPEQRGEWLKKVIGSVKNKNTDIELILQKGLINMGIGFNTQIYVPGVAIIDIVPKNTKLAVFADGNYWHNYPDGKEYDRKQTKKLQKLGWTVLRFWGSEIKNNSKICLLQISEMINQ